MTLDRSERNGSIQRTTSPNRGLAVWFTGLSGAGKTTLCRMLEPQLRDRGYPVLVLDADEIRRRLNGDLGFSKADRDENVRRLGETARLLVQQNFVVLVAAISPYREAREQARRQIGGFLEVYVNASLATCIARDPKGLYARALRGEIRYFTGIEDPYEPPLHPDVECNTDIETREESVRKVLAAIRHVQRGRLFSVLRSSKRRSS
jgi:adenylylsulfate kinase